MSKIGLLFTGGTFLSSEGKYWREVSRSSADKNQEKTRAILNLILSGDKFIAKEIYNIDSSDLAPKHRLAIKNTIEQIEKEEWNMDGYILIHGTDTLEYTASALSFLLKDMKWNLIITGAMQSIEASTSDAPDNLKCSLQALDQLCSSGGHYVAFGEKLLQWNKVRKVDTHSKMTFNTPWYNSIGKFEDDSLILDSMQNKNYLDSIDHTIVPLFKQMDALPNVQLIKFFPWMNFQIFDYLSSIPDLKGLVLEWYWDGNFPKDRALTTAIKNLIKKWIFVVIKSQCITWYVDHKYEWAKKILDIDHDHIISWKNMTSPATLTKLMRVLSQTEDPQQVKSYMEKNIAGEML